MDTNNPVSKASQMSFRKKMTSKVKGAFAKGTASETEPYIEHTTYHNARPLGAPRPSCVEIEQVIIQARREERDADQLARDEEMARRLQTEEDQTPLPEFEFVLVDPGAEFVGRRDIGTGRVKNHVPNNYGPVELKGVKDNGNFVVIQSVGSNMQYLVPANNLVAAKTVRCINCNHMKCLPLGRSPCPAPACGTILEVKR